MEPDDQTGEEGSRSDPGTETGIEASMSRLGLGGGGGNESYPERPDEPDCVYYLRTGVCGYGSRCQFNHPPNRPPVVGDLRTEAGEVPERMGQPVCQHFMRAGACKFGASCKYHHPRQGSGGGGGGDSVTTPISFNHMGLPLRPCEKECPYYMRTGQCKFGSTCKFHHPVPPGDQPPSQHPLSACPQAIYPSQQFGVVVPRPYGTYSQMVLPPPGMVGWNPYQASVSAIPSPGTLGPSPVYGTKPLSPSAPAYQSGGPSPNKEQYFPQRPGQPECTYFLRTGDCKYGTSCRYHHPLEAASPKGVTLTHTGLPLRPGTAQCSQGTEVQSSSSIKPITTTSGGSETVTDGVSSSSSVTGGVASHSEPAKTKNGDSASIEVKTSS